MIFEYIIGITFRQVSEINSYLTDGNFLTNFFIVDLLAPEPWPLSFLLVFVLLQGRGPYHCCWCCSLAVALILGIVGFVVPGSWPLSLVLFVLFQGQGPYHCPCFCFWVVALIWSLLCLLLQGPDNVFLFVLRQGRDPYHCDCCFCCSRAVAIIIVYVVSVPWPLSLLVLFYWFRPVALIIFCLSHFRAVALIIVIVCAVPGPWPLSLLLLLFLLFPDPSPYHSYCCLFVPGPWP